MSLSELDKNSSDVAAEGAILNEMLEIVAKRQALRPSLDAAAAAAAASVGGAAAALPPRSKDVSDVSTDEQELEEELEELEEAGIERDCVAVASTSSGRNSSSNRERCLNNRSYDSVGSGRGQGTAAAGGGGGRGFAAVPCSVLLGLLLLLASLYYYELLLECFNFY